MAFFVLRVWLPDKPGALGRVASAIGSVGASLVGIDILEQSGGWAIDELVIEAVDSPNAIDKLISALTLLGETNVEDIREMRGELVDARVDALETAAELVEEVDADGLMKVLVQRALHDMSADWVVLLKEGEQTSTLTAGAPPALAWVRAFLAGSRTADAVTTGRVGPDDIAFAEMTLAGLTLVLGRNGRPLRARERRQLTALARIADRRLADFSA